MFIPLNEKAIGSCTVCRDTSHTAYPDKAFRTDVENDRSTAAIDNPREKYRRLFNSAAVPLWELDLSAVKQALDDLRNRIDSDVRTYLKETPEFVSQILTSIKITDINSATLKLFRVESKSDFHNSIDKLLTSQTRAVFSDFLVNIHEGKPDFNSEIICKTFTGEEINIQIHLELPPDPISYNCIIVSGQDISERKRLEVQFLNAQKMEAIGTLASGIAHDFNNLLMAIEGLTTLMMHDITPDDPHYTTLHGIEKQVHNGAKLTAQLLGYARKEQHEISSVDLNQVVKEIAEAFSRARKQIAVTLNLEQDLHDVKADPGQIEQVLLNLCVNAADAMPEGGRLTIQTCKKIHSDIHSPSMIPKPGDYVQLTVRDTGDGMDEETRKRIFEPFFTTKTMGRGTGLGLVSVLAIIKRLGGVIDVESEIEHGTAFNIYLPAIPKNIKKSMADTAVKSVVTADQTVLLVDDEEVVLDVGTRILQRIGFTVFSAGNGEDALNIYSENKNRIDLVILDMVMPDMGGKIVFERMKQLEPAVKVLLASGYSLNDEATEIMQKGCNGFIQKPYNLEELTTKIEQILQHS